MLRLIPRGDVLRASLDTHSTQHQKNNPQSQPTYRIVPVDTSVSPTRQDPLTRVLFETHTSFSPLGCRKAKQLCHVDKDHHPRSAELDCMAVMSQLCSGDVKIQQTSDRNAIGPAGPRHPAAESPPAQELPPGHASCAVDGHGDQTHQQADGEHLIHVRRELVRTRDQGRDAKATAWLRVHTSDPVAVW